MNRRSYVGISFILLCLLLNPWLSYAATQSTDDPQKIHSTFNDKLTVEEQAWLKAHPQISMGIMNAWPPMNFVDGAGYIRGIGADHIHMVNKRLGGIIKLIPGSFKDNLDAVKNKRLDALMDVTPKPEREKYLNFTSRYLSIPHVIVALAGGPYFESEYVLAGKTLALEAGFYNVRYFKDKYPSVKIKTYFDTAQALGAVSRGEADAYVGNRAVAAWIMEQELISNLQIQGRTEKPGSVLAIGVRKDWPLFASILDKALADMTVEEEHDIHRRWSGMLPENKKTARISLTPGEQTWIAEHPVIKIGIGESWAPLVYVNHDGSLKGYDVDFMAKIKDLTGLNIQLKAGQWKDIVEQAQHKKIDGLAESAVVESRREYFLFSEPYNIVQYAAATLPEKAVGINSDTDLKGKRIAHLKGNMWTGKIIDSIGAVKAIEAESEKEAVQFVVQGRADYALITLHQFGQLRQLYHQSIVIAHVFTREEHVLKTVYSIRKDWPELVSILNKALLEIDENQRQALLEKWVPVSAWSAILNLSKPVPFGIAKFLLKSLGAVFVLMVLIIFIAWLVKGRPRQLSIRDSMFLISFVFASFIAASSVFVILLSRTQEHENYNNERNRQALNLAFELKQSSDDLTRFARAYAVTGNPKYEKHFRTITAIRDGRRAHPENFTPFYWDYVSAGEVEPDQNGEVYSIEQKMMTLGLSGEERSKLTEAKKESDDLINLEDIAMNAVKGLYQDSRGQFTIHKAPDLEMARRILHGSEYHKAKARIMKPIEQFFTLLKWRMALEENQMSRWNQAIIIGITILIIATIGFSIYVFFWLRRRIIFPLAALESGARRIKEGDYSHHIPLSFRDEVGSLASAFNAMSHSIEEKTSRLNATIESTTDGILVVDLNQCVTTFNTRFLDIWHLDREMLEAGDDKKLLDAVLSNLEDPKTFLTHVRHLYNNPEQEDFSTLALCDGRILERYSRPQQIGERIIGRVWSFRDVSERYRTEAEMRKLSRAIEASPASVIVTDTDGSIEYVNPRFTEITGYSAEEVIGQSTSILRSGIHSLDFYKKIWSTIEAGHVWTGEICNRKKNGELYWEAAAIAPVKDAHGKISNYVAVREDISKRKQAEEDLKNAKEAAEVAAQSKSDFLANMSHEIRTPMNAIIGMNYLALKTDLTPKQQYYISKIDSSAKSLLGIIDDILDFSKIEANKLDMEIIDFKLDQVMSTLSNVVSGKAQEKGLELIFDIHLDTPINLKGDPLRLGQVLLNLTNNAVKFTETGEIVVGVQPLEIKDDRTLIRFSIRDTGIGLSKEQQEKLFQSFQQADASTTRRFGGTGLGLTISKKLTEMMGGKIWIESEQGAGSTFFFTAEFGRHKGAVPKKRIMPESLRAIKIMVVDDNETFRQVMKTYLEEFGFETRTYASGSEALDILNKTASIEHNSFDIIFMDWQMPGMDGIETSREIWKMAALQPVPKIILTTGFGQEQAMNQADGEHLDGFLEKPVTPSLLLDSIMAVFGQVVSYRSERKKDTGFRPLGFDNIRGARILLVEDNEINQQLATELLQEEEFFVTIADNGQIALDKIYESSPDNLFDIILMDLQMPVMDGYTATEKIREDERFKDIPIIAMTADAMTGAKERTAKVGMDDYVTKPIDPDLLFRALVKWIKPGERRLPKDFGKKDQKAIHRKNAEFVLPGFDTERALARMGGSVKVYRKILFKVFESEKNVMERIRTHLDAGDRESAVRAAHTLKGVAGTIGAVKLQSAAGKLESELKDEAELFQDSWAIMEKVLGDALNAIEAALLTETKMDSHTAELVDLDDVRSVLDKIKAQIDNFDSSAQETCEILADQLRGGPLEQSALALGKAMAVYDFEAAERFLNDIITAVG
nr:transporter substrate-binding domain-containing protein [uncultured Desulfobacter sp.]